MSAVVQRRLNPVDCAMLTVDRTLRKMGACGFETQALLWLAGRIDAAALRTSIARFSTLYPIATARIVENGHPCWCFQPGAVCPLHEMDLSSAADTAVLDIAGRLLSAPSDPSQTDPVRFHLLHRPSGRDVFLVQYNHALMDNNASVLLLREIDLLFGGAPETSVSRHEEGTDLVWEYLRQFPRERRRQAASTALYLITRSARGGVASLGGGADKPGRTELIPFRHPAELRIATRCLEEESTRILHERVRAAGGYPSVSMAVAGSAFRAIGRLAPRQGVTGSGLVAGIGIDLGLRGPTGPIFQNLVSLIPVSARPDDLGDREALVRMLSRQMRERLAGDADLGMLQSVALLFRRPRPDVVWAIDLFLRKGFSLWYGCFGSVDVDTFCGAPVERVVYAGPAWSEVGLTLLVNQHRGRMFFQATYTPQTVAEELAERFLEEVVGDLV